MENTSITQFSLNFKEIIIDEIALDGLEGIGIDLLWRRIEKRISAQVTTKMKIRYWNFIVTCQHITIYELPEPVPHIKIYDRFEKVNEQTGHVEEYDEYIDGPYEYCPIENEYGSCKYYDTRTVIQRESLQGVAYEQIIAESGDRLVLVASIEERWKALAPHKPITAMKHLTTISYCVLELIGKGRENGQVTHGKTNLLKILKDFKLLFYIRNSLKKSDLITILSVTHVIEKRGKKALLLRLKRFHTPLILCMPKAGKLCNIYQHLMTKPDYTDRTETMIKKGLLTYTLVKKLQRNVSIFDFEEKPLQGDDINNQSQVGKDIKRKLISLKCPSDQSEESEDETAIKPLKCQYKVGVGLLRQAYEMFLEAGLKGCTQIEISQLLGVEFYTARTICRTFKMKNLVREFLEDQGRQRTGRYIAVLATSEMDAKFQEEKKKFLEYRLENQKARSNEDPLPVNEDSDTDVPIKKRKLEKKSQNVETENVVVDCTEIEKHITELKILTGLEDRRNICPLLASKKGPTLRQLRFANGLLKILREKLVITGYQTLSFLVSKEVNEPPMDTKSLKVFVQKLVTDGQIKVLKVKWPGVNNNYSIFICSPHVKLSDPVIKTKYKEIALRAINYKNHKVKIPAPGTFQGDLSVYSYPRYMKIQKLHELLMKFVYFGEENNYLSDLPEGFCSLADTIPELTVEFALGNITNKAVSQLLHVKVQQDNLKTKLRNVPNELFKKFLHCLTLQKSIKSNLIILAMFGLIQLVKPPMQHQADESALSFVFYVSRQTKIVDTTGVWPRANVKKEELEISYHFTTIDVVKKFWSDVYKISTTTTIDVAARTRKSLTPIVRSMDEVLSNDNGQCEGNGLGPCGFDASFFMDMPRQWNTFYLKEKKRHQLLKSKNKVNFKVTKKESRKNIKTIKKTIRKKKKTILKPKVVMDPNVKKLRKDRRESVPTWSKDEDKIIVLCKAAISVISPVSQIGCLKLRNLAAKDILTINDPKKTGNNCHKRAMYLDSNSSMEYEKECIVNEFRYRRNLLQKYEGVLKDMCIKYQGSLTKVIAETRLPVLEVVWIMYQLIKSSSYNKRVPCVAMNLEDFHKNYTITCTSPNRTHNLYKTPTDDPMIATIKEGIILAVMMSYKTELYSDMAKKIYSIFQSQSEQSLRTAVEQLRKCGAIAAKEKQFGNQLHRFNPQDVVQTSYKISVAYQRKWISKLNSQFVDKLVQNLDSTLPNLDLKGTPELNCLLCEEHACNAIDIELGSAPVVTGSSCSLIQEEQLSLGEVDIKYMLKSGSCRWKNKLNVNKLSDLFDDSLHEEAMEDLMRRATLEYVTVNEDIIRNDKILVHLQNKTEKGSTFADLLEVTGYDSESLKAKLAHLESENVIKRVGYYENLIILTEYKQFWTVCVGKKHIIPAPWLNLATETVRYDVFFNWAGVIINKIFEKPGSSIAYLSNSTDYFTARSTQEVCMFFEKCKCVRLSVLKSEEQHLFSDCEQIPEIDEFNPYESIDNIIVFPEKNCLTKFAWIKLKILGNTDE